MDVDPAGGLFEGYELKLNSYDLGVDIELNDAVQRLRFEHPEVGAVVIRSGKESVFCAGANIRMLGKASHGHKVNFCKFTNETRMAIEDATRRIPASTISRAVSGTAAGGGYELAVTAEHIMLVDDRRSSVSLPETPLLAVLPGTGGLTRLTDKRRVRRDRADVFCSTEEGVRGRRAVEWRLVDEVVPPSAWEATVTRARRRHSPRAPTGRRSCAGRAADCRWSAGSSADSVIYSHLRVGWIGRPRRATSYRAGPEEALPADLAGMHAAGRCASGRCRWRASWMTPSCICAPTSRISVCWVLRTEGDAAAVLAYDALLEAHRSLADARDPPLPQAHVQAAGRDLAQPDRPDRAGQLFRRHAGRTGLRRRPLG